LDETTSLYHRKKAFLKSAKKESIDTFDVAEYSRPYVNGLNEFNN
jgi:hypothetical protein